jgi:hypothetical protein
MIQNINVKPCFIKKYCIHPIKLLNFGHRTAFEEIFNLPIRQLSLQQGLSAYRS